MFNTDSFKQAVLDKAMKGQLTKQVPEDGSAIDLLNEIKKEKESLIKAKKVKKSKSLPEIQDAEIPFKIPDNWKWARLGEISNINTGNTPPKNNLSYYDSKDIYFVKPGDLKNNYVKYSKEYISNKAIQKAKIASKNSIFVVGIGGSIGKLGIANKRMAFNQQLHNIKPIILNYKFIYYALSSNNMKVQFKKQNGTATPIVNKSKISNFILPLPPLSEQQRIVEDINKCFELSKYIEKEQKLSKNFHSDMKKSLLQSAMMGKLTKQLPEDGNANELLKQIENKKQQLIDEKKIKKQKPLPKIKDDEIPFDIPNNWKWVRLGEITNLLIGKTPSRNNSEYWNGEIPWVSVKDMNNGVLYKTNEKITEKAGIEKFKNNIIPKGKLLMSFKLSIGKICILGIPAYHNEAIVSFNFYRYPNDLKNYLFKTIQFLTKFANSKNAVQGKTLNKSSLNNMLIPLPPISEQKRIVEKLDELFSHLEN